jgi:hypothetical protein
MKLVSKAHAGRTLALISGKITVDAEGVVEVTEEVAASLEAVGFISVLAQSKKTEEEIEEIIEESKIPLKKEQPRFKRNK